GRVYGDGLAPSQWIWRGCRSAAEFQPERPVDELGRGLGKGGVERGDGVGGLFALGRDRGIEHAGAGDLAFVAQYPRRKLHDRRRLRRQRDLEVADAELELVAAVELVAGAVDRAELVRVLEALQHA